MSVDHRGLGIWLGFPPCCIEAFITNINQVSNEWCCTPNGRKVAYVPCKECGEQIDQIGLDTYISTRVIPYREALEPYPTCTPENDVPQFYT